MGRKGSSSLFLLMLQNYTNGIKRDCTYVTGYATYVTDAVDSQLYRLMKIIIERIW